MKKMLLLLLMLYSGVQAQTINLSDYAKKSDFDKLTNKVDRQQKTIDSLTAMLTGGVVKPPVVLKKCPKGPTIVEIRNVTSKGFEIQFDADSVFNMKYTVTGAKVYIDSIKPTRNTFAVIFPTQFPNGAYTFSIEGINCSGSNSRIFTIAGGVDPPSAADCKKQPTFKINGFTNQAATVQFDADGLKTLTLSLVQGTETIRTVTYNPDVNTLFFPFGKVIPAGNYKIKLTPVSCTADVTNQEFTIKSEDTGAVDPPVETDPGAADYKRITKGMEEHMSITRRTVGDLDYITDNTANPLQSGHKYHYIAGAQVITQSTPLKDYPFARNNGFRIVKFNKKDGVQSMNEWPGQNEDGNVPGGYYKNDAGQSFSFNSSAAVETGAFTGSQSGFKNHFPAGYNPALDMPQWLDLVPELKLPKGHFFVLSKGDWTVDQVLKKGITHIRHNEIPRLNGDETLALQLRMQGVTYNDVPISTQIFGGVPNNPSDAQVDAMIARHAYPDALWIGETQEQTHAIKPESRWLYKFNAGITANQKKNFIDKGIPALNCFNYFQFWPKSYHLGQVSADSSKAMFRYPLDLLPYSNFSPGAPLSSTTLIMEAVYLGAPDIQDVQPFDLAYKLSLIKHLGYESGAFSAGEHEWRPNNMYWVQYPEGKYFSKSKIALDPNTLITAAFFSQVYGKVFVLWGGIGKINAGKIVDDLTSEPTYWKPNGSDDLKGSTLNPDPNAGNYTRWVTSPDFPHSRRGGIGYFGYNGSSDIARFGLQVYADTWGQIPEDGSKNFLSYRLDGGEWINAVNEYVDEIVNARHGKRGIVHSIHKAGQIAWFYINPFADNLWHNLEVRFPNGRTVKNRVAGNGIHAKLESL